MLRLVISIAQNAGTGLCHSPDEMEDSESQVTSNLFGATTVRKKLIMRKYALSVATLMKIFVKSLFSVDSWMVKEFLLHSSLGADTSAAAIIKMVNVGTQIIVFVVI